VGGGGVTAFFNVAFRFDEPLPDVSDPSEVVGNPSWWRDRAQGTALQTGDLSAFHADVDFGKLADGAGDESGVPRTGVLNRIVASRFEPEQGVDFNRECGSSDGCAGELLGRLQPYALYVPAKPAAGGRYGLQLLLHSLGANHNQFSGSRNQSQFGDRGRGHLVVTPAGRGPDGWYYDRAGADTFEVWADVARRYALDPDVTSIAGYSMGGYGTYKFATQFPDLFAKGQPTVGPPGLGVWVPPNPPAPGGERSNTFRQLASLRHIPFLIWNASSDQLVPLPGPQRQAQGFDDLGYRSEFDVFSPADHFTLAIHDQYAPAAEFLGDAAVGRDPARVSYVRNPTMDFADAGTTADHAYWLSAIALREGSGDAPLGTLDAGSGGIPKGDAPVSDTERGAGSLGGGNRGALAYASQARKWGATPSKPRTDSLALTVRNVGTVTVHPGRARITCGAALKVDTDGPVRVVFAGCGRTEAFSGADTFTRAGAA
jgi:predicted esterase